MYKNIFFSVCVFLLGIMTAQAQRNTILIIADDLSPDYFGFYENHVDTVDVPNIRALLAKGVRFRNLMSNPVCSSTRTTILTGRYSFRTGVGNIVGSTGGSGEIDTAEISIPKLLKIHNPNIRKANIGKWHLKSPMPPANLTSPLTLGYDWFEGPFIGQLPSFTNWTKYTNGVASTITTYATTENVNNTVAWLKAQNATKPFFVWLAFNAPHAPLHLPPANLHTYTALTGTTADINLHPKEYFKADIQAMDREMGRLFDSLRAMNKLDSTDIIFIGDNGNTQRTAQILDLNKAKGTVYQYGVNVPMILAGPSVVNKGRVSNALVNTADLFATIVENFGFNNWQNLIPTNKPVDSKSLMPIIKNTSDSVRAWSFCEIFKITTDNADGKAMRNRNYKLIRFDAGSEEFYNLANDSLENNNLLQHALNPIELSNYQYICNEMTNLVGSNIFCPTSATDEKRAENHELKAYPNPFSSFISIENNDPPSEFIFTNATGTVIYSGKEIEKQDFSALPKGVYFLKSKNGYQKMIK